MCYVTCHHGHDGFALPFFTACGYLIDEGGPHGRLRLRFLPFLFELLFIFWRFFFADFDWETGELVERTENAFTRVGFGWSVELTVPRPLGR